ncbi:MAG: hypothetical protein K2X82_01380 [Gemmataceae bacterium]|nr:hypothetical protein [Gemmataceae bacterium]
MTANDFRAALAAEFPEVAAMFAENYATGLLHCEVGCFRQATEEAIDSGRHWLAERHFRFVEQAMVEADHEVRNALELSYLEDSATGEHTPERHRVVKERMPAALRRRLIELGEWWE